MKTMTHTVRHVGMIGLGEMGNPMARHLLGKRFSVHVHDLRAEAMAELEAAGAIPHPSPQALAAAVEVVIVMVGFEKELRAIVLDDGGILAGARPGLIIVVSSTVDPSTVREIAALCKARHVDLVDAPVTRGVHGAREGTLLVMAGGDPEVINRCRSVFAAYATDVFRVGDLGAGQVGKATNNMILWACTVANWEAKRLVEGYGMDFEALLPVLSVSSAANYALANWHSERKMAWAEKDMSIVAEMSERQRLSLPLAELVRVAISRVKADLGLPVPQSHV